MGSGVDCTGDTVDQYARFLLSSCGRAMMRDGDDLLVVLCERAAWAVEACRSRWKAAVWTGRAS